MANYELPKNNKFSVVAAGNVGLGQVGSALLDNGESAASLGTSAVVAITMLEDTTFTTLTQSDAVITGTGTSTHGNSVVNTDVFPAGVTIYGNWTAVTVNVGLCIAYLG
tara:strand:+ start:3290 stop:3616 length:327 start_codon:yes stop_codon:yes gene_type:complete